MSGDEKIQTDHQGLQRFGAALQPYIYSLLGLAAVTGAIAVTTRMLGWPIHLPLTVLLGFAFVVVFLWSAWQGYGPGVLVCVVGSLVRPHMIVTDRVSLSRPDAVRLGLMIAISLLVSYIGESHRRRESELRQQAEDLERRVRERTDQLLVSALEKHVAEDRLRFVLDSADVGYWDYDVARSVTARSPQHDRIFGYRKPLDHWDYKVFLRHVHAEDREKVDRQLRATMEHGKRSLEFRIVWPDGSIRWLWALAQMHPGQSGEPAHISGVIVDITARRRTADELREQAQLLDMAHDAIITLDLGGRIQFWSRGAERMYGYSGAEAKGAVIHDLLKTKFPEPLDIILKKTAEFGHWEGELAQCAKDGTEIVAASRWALRVGAQGQQLGLLEINTDTTERRRMEEQLRHTQKLESLGVLAGGVAHDFNNLLTGILGNASLALDRTPQQHPNRMLLEEVMLGAERAADLTRQLLAYAGKGRFVMRNIDLSGLVKEISGLIQSSIPKAVQLRLQLGEPGPGILADPGQMQQIVMNLVINGAEAIGPEGGTVVVRTCAQAVDEAYIASLSSAGELLKPGPHVMLEVSDNGCGMDEQTLRKVFDPFFTTKFAGRGLGLSAVLGIVRAHKGALKVYSQPGRGTTFKLLFPVFGDMPPLENTPPAEAGELAGCGTVLIVDDEELVRHTARHTLERYGYRTLVAENGQEAVETFQRERNVSLVLLDLTMPIMGGEETLRQLKTINPGVRVLLSSGYNETEAVERFAGEGLAGFIQKPYTAAGLAECVKQVMEQAA
jgi:PAS domain S-box-containing protein